MNFARDADTEELGILSLSLSHRDLGVNVEQTLTYRQTSLAPQRHVQDAFHCLDPVTDTNLLAFPFATSLSTHCHSPLEIIRI